MTETKPHCSDTSPTGTDDVWLQLGSEDPGVISSHGGGCPSSAEMTECQIPDGLFFNRNCLHVLEWSGGGGGLLTPGTQDACPLSGEMARSSVSSRMADFCRCFSKVNTAHRVTGS